MSSQLNTSDPSDPSNFSTTLTPPRSPRLRTPSSSCVSSGSHSPSSQPPTLPSIRTSLLKSSLSLKRDFRFLKQTTRESSSLGSTYTIDNSDGIQKLLRSSLIKLNETMRGFVKDANELLDEEINKSFDAFLHGNFGRQSARQFDEDGGSDSDSGYSSPSSPEERSEGWDDEIETMMMSTEEKDTRKELKRLVGVVEELRGVFFKKAGKYLFSAKERDGGEEVVEELVVGKLLNENKDDVVEGLEKLARRLGMVKR
ncbi:hypothetical protein B0T20DRAFT_431411 [Sordaria brevicollis]|uniref:Uncharacterized protein n=1 Tax=Sordaria brevicollis TaxID=83679 RepID=A0AAE0PL40_SORBR|nr:hypothetical protein B0T20DRAFT_431411 [Sordaria brevicollis]